MQIKLYGIGELNLEKILAMYLPQFYETPENNKWWGKGFTEWVSAKNAEKLFDGHYQPHVPLNYNYYNLLDKETMLNQVSLMKKYNVYGMCFYHYWFKNGKKMLEKPAENLLIWKDIDMPFCFAWANESWARSWSNIDEKNTWVSCNENKAEMENNPSGVLLEQDYGNEKAWERHFNYLKNFFLDERYIKVDNKPMFVIYKPNSINCFLEMKQIWDKLAKEEGFDGIYYIACNTFKDNGYNSVLLQEPQYTFNNNPCKPYANNNIRGYYDYEDVWKKITERKINKNNIIYGGFVGYDDTPRRNKGGTVIGANKPEIFKKYLKKLLKINELNGNEYVFINAWNEWGEGMHLEPDEKNGYKYLQAVKEALEEYNNVDITNTVNDNDIKKDYKMLRYESYWKTLHQWLILKEKNLSVEDYLMKNRYKNIAIYGLGMLGKHLVRELENTEVQIKYGIDENADSLMMSIPIVTADVEKYNEIDLIIVTVVYDFDEIKKKLVKQTDVEIISLLELLKSVENND